MNNLHTQLLEMPPDQRRQTLDLLNYAAKAGESEQFCRLLTNFNFMEAKILILGTQALIADYELVNHPHLLIADADRTDLHLICDALRLSAHVLAEDSTQLPRQLLGRLMSHEGNVIGKLLKQAKQQRTAWLRPLTPSLTPPAGFLQNTFDGYMSPFVITPDGQSVVSASFDGVLKLWNLDTGAVVRQFAYSTLIQFLTLLPP